MKGHIRRYLLLAVSFGVLCVFGVLGCEAHLQQDSIARVVEMRRWFEEHRSQLPAAESRLVADGLAMVERRCRAGELSLVALTAVEGRMTTIGADEVFSVIEARHLLEMLADVPHWDDEVHALKYMGLR